MKGRPLCEGVHTGAVASCDKNARPLAMLNVPLIDVRRPIGPNIRADITAARADHLSAERPHQHVIGQPIAAHGRDDTGIGLPSIRNSMPDSPSTSSMPITSMFAGA